MQFCLSCKITCDTNWKWILLVSVDAPQTSLEVRFRPPRAGRPRGTKPPLRAERAPQQRAAVWDGSARRGRSTPLGRNAPPTRPSGVDRPRRADPSQTAARCCGARSASRRGRLARYQSVISRIRTSSADGGGNSTEISGCMVTPPRAEQLRGYGKAASSTQSTIVHKNRY
jgi:hypothetical protein